MHPPHAGDSGRIDSAERADPLLALLRERFGFPDFRPGQRAVIEALQRDGAALALFPTGAGKSLCAQLPALLFEGVTVIVSPLIALMKDQIDALGRRGIAAARLDSSLDRDELRGVTADLRSGALKLLYVAPERFNNERFLDQLGRVRIALFAVDEAHCISEWGHAFRPDYLKLAQLARELGAERLLAMTATATPAVVEDIRASFGIPERAAVITSFYRPELRLLTSPTPAAERDAALVARLTDRPPGSGIVYVTRQQTAERVAALLADAGLPARAYHAGMETEARTEVQDWWAASDRAVVVATIAFGMGIDKADVRFIDHYDLPKGPESYAQEIGRAGRDGREAVVELLGSVEDVAALENFAHGDTPTPEALRGLVDEVLGAGAEFEVDLNDLANRFDIRPIVVRTALTYLELAGLIRQGTPVYATYQARLLESEEAILARLPAEPRAFLAGVFAAARRGRVWLTIAPAETAAGLGQERARVTRALDYLGEQGLAEVRVADVRHRYTRLVEAIDAAATAADLIERFARHEQRQIERVGRLVDLITHDGCQTNALLAYFGELRAEPCGHCTHCETGRPAAMPPPPPRRPIEALVPTADLAALIEAAPEALAHPRQQARLLCGLSSPALTRRRLTRHPLFGAAAAHRFADILAWRQRAAPASG